MDDNKTMTASEKMAESRREMQEREAIERLNLVWGLRGVFDVFMSVVILVLMYRALTDGNYSFLGMPIVLLALFVGEFIAIVGFFTRKPWCVLPLHVFAAISLLNIPIGTILSAIHFFNITKVRFVTPDK
ncbi:MAG TPA: hypothetical protein VIC08_00080 [Cellvibrionaceae bacterium]